MNTPALEACNLVKQFGALHAVAGVSLRVEPGERHAIIGPNGAGKTTFFNLLAGELRPTAGSVSLFGQDVSGLPSFRRCQLGMARTFQRNNLFLGLSVQDNLQLGVRRLRSSASLPIPLPSESRSTSDHVGRLLIEVGLASRAGSLARELSYGEQRQLEVALALASGPRVLLLDEPTAGMSPTETAHMTDLIQGLPRDVTVLIIEHDMDVVFEVADVITVLHFGEVLASGKPADVRASDLVQEAYLGAVPATPAIHV